MTRLSNYPIRTSLRPRSTPPPSFETVLVIDDSDIARAEMGRLLVNAGFRVIALASPIGATRAILDNDVNVVVIDVQMPSIRGDRLAALFRGNPRFETLGVVLVSGEGERELQRLAAEVDADAVVAKSNLSELVPAVQRLTRGPLSSRIPRSG